MISFIGTIGATRSTACCKNDRLHQERNQLLGRFLAAHWPEPFSAPPAIMITNRFLYRLCLSWCFNRLEQCFVNAVTAGTSFVRFPYFAYLIYKALPPRQVRAFGYHSRLLWSGDPEADAPAASVWARNLCGHLRDVFRDLLLHPGHPLT